MALPVTPRDILIRWVGDNKPYSDDDETFVELFKDAIDLTLNKVPNLEELVSNGQTSLSTVKQVITAMMTRYYAVSQEYRSSYSETVSSFSHSGSYSSDKEGRGVMSLLPDEINLLSGFSESRKVASIEWHTESKRPYDDGWVLNKIYPLEGVRYID